MSMASLNILKKNGTLMCDPEIYDVDISMDINIKVFLVISEYNECNSFDNLGIISGSLW